ncbi:MAG: phosphate ABC transporter permease subunit PstC [Chloroflexi bacterium]|nr:phosphate ABC transporter permease subunit PstC [Chloroflexota bacterium]
MTENAARAVQVEKLGLKTRVGNRGDTAFRGVVTLLACGILALVALMVIKMADGSMPAIQRFGLGFLWGTTWDPVAQEFGALPFIFGTVVSSSIALLVGGPIGLGAAIYLSELAPDWLRNPVSFLVELLAAIPSVVYGLWGVFVMAPWLRSALEPLLSRSLGFLPLFQGPSYGIGMLAGGLILAIMILPTITAVSRDVMRAVPRTQREGMLALGATPWEVIWGAVMPYARSGILGSVILGLGRALGETMAVTMVIGNRPDISASLFAPSYTMASVIANEFSEATYNLYLSALIEIGLALFGVTLLLNALARLLVWRTARMPAGGG